MAEIRRRRSGRFVEISKPILSGDGNLEAQVVAVAGALAIALAALITLASIDIGVTHIVSMVRSATYPANPYGISQKRKDVTIAFNALAPCVGPIVGAVIWLLTRSSSMPRRLAFTGAIGLLVAAASFVPVAAGPRLG